VADAFDNMTTEHPYRAAMGHQHAFNELRLHSHAQFCPQAVQAFCAGFVKSRLNPKFFPGRVKPARRAPLVK
jgi:HD-GYP domain-containing protein (c-di-GMP phosphodiesterase class II)